MLTVRSVSAVLRVRQVSSCERRRQSCYSAVMNSSAPHALQRITLLSLLYLSTNSFNPSKHILTAIQHWPVQLIFVRQLSQIGQQHLFVADAGVVLIVSALSIPACDTVPCKCTAASAMQ
eukprot:14866-Heterococcus_DN1.PRE.3